MNHQHRIAGEEMPIIIIIRFMDASENFFITIWNIVEHIV